MTKGYFQPKIWFKLIAKWPLSTYFRSVRTNVAFTTNIAAGGDTSHPNDDHQCEPTLGGEKI